MDAAELRAVQKPLKDAYRERPESARVTLRAEGRLEGDGITCTVDTWAGPARAGLHGSTGGDDTDACSGDMLLQALAACAGVTMRSVATAMRMELADATVTVEGTWDARGTLGLDPDVPVGFTDVTVTLGFRTDADEQQVERLVALTEKYCVVGRTLAQPPRLTVRHEAAG